MVKNKVNLLNAVPEAYMNFLATEIRQPVLFETPVLFFQKKKIKYVLVTIWFHHGV